MYQLKYDLPISLKAQNGPAQESVNLEISVQGLAHWDPKNPVLDIEAFTANVDFVSSGTNQIGKTLAVTVNETLHLQADPCMQITAEAGLKKIDDKGKSSLFAMSFSPAQTTVNKTVINTSAGWNELYADCSQKPVLDYLRLIFVASPKKQ